MTVLIKGITKDYIGLSSDSKPMNVLEGSTYHAVDTGEHWIFHDFMWEIDYTYVWAIQVVQKL